MIAALPGIPGAGAMAGMPGLGLDSLLATVRDAQAKAGGDRQAMAEMLRQQLGAQNVVVDGSSGFQAAAPEDPIELLSKLSDLRDKGLVTDEEFEAQKRRLLG